jgi:hypothetical protein
MCCVYWELVELNRLFNYIGAKNKQAPHSGFYFASNTNTTTASTIKPFLNSMAHCLQGSLNISQPAKTFEGMIHYFT